MEIIFSAKSAEKYACEYCDTICIKKNDWVRHLQTKKHLRNSGKNKETKFSANDFKCKCGKKYYSNSGLWKHKKKCKYLKKKIKKKKFLIIKNYY